ncbi:MAG: hypothetical protein ACPGFB_16405 [Verrucomicrobiales bacterium]
MILFAVIFAVCLVSIVVALYAQERRGVSVEGFVVVMLLVGAAALLGIFFS